VIDGGRDAIAAGTTSIAVSATLDDGTALTGSAAICVRPR
jgi:hypothetical protein